MVRSRVKLAVITVAVSLVLSGVGVTSASAASAAPTTWSAVTLPADVQTKVLATARDHLITSGGTHILARTWSTLEGSDGSIAVSWRLAGGGVNSSSSASVVLNSRLRFTYSTQTDLTLDALGGEVARSWQDGALAKTSSMTAKQVAIAVATAQRSGSGGAVITSSMSADCRNALTALGVLAAMAAVACIAGPVSFLCIGLAIAAIIASAYAMAKCR